MFGYAWQTVRTRPSRFAGAFVALAAAAALISACGLLMQSGIVAGIPPQRYAATDLVAVGAAPPDLAGVAPADRIPLSADDLTTIGRVPGVARVAGEVGIPLTVVTAAGLPVGNLGNRHAEGHGWGSSALTAVRLVEGAAPTGRHDIALDRALAQRAGVAVGGQVRVAVGSTPRTYRVSGLAAIPAGELRQSAAYFSDEEAVALSGRPSQFPAGLVQLAPGADRGQVADRIERVLGDRAEVRSGNSRGRAEFRDAAATATLLLGVAGSFGGIAAIVAMFVVAGTLGLAVQERRREFALLRAVAATPRQIRRLISAEILIVASVAAGLGSVLGLGLVWLVRAAFVSIDVVPGDYRLSIGPIPLAAAVLLTLLTAAAAGRLTARRVLRIRPVEALGDAAVETPKLGVVRTVLGSLVLAGGLVMSSAPSWTEGTLGALLAATASLPLVVGAGLLGPRLVRWCLWLVAPLVRARSATGYLAAANARTHARRLSSAIVPLVVTITITVVQVSVGVAQVEHAERQAVEGTKADLVLASAGAGLSPGLLTRVRQLPGVGSAAAVVQAEVILRTPYPRRVTIAADEPPTTESYGAQGVTRQGVTETMDLGVLSGELSDLGPETVAVSRAVADTADAGLGDRIEVILGDGSIITPRVIAIYARGDGFGEITFDHDVLLAHTSARLASAVLVRARPEVSVAALRDQVASVTQAALAVTVADRAMLAAAQKKALEQNRSINLILFVVLFGYILVNAANTLVVTTSERRREFALLGLVGASPAQVRRMMRLEGLVITAIAVFLGSVLSLPPLIGLSLGFSQGRDATPDLSLPAATGTVVAVVLITWASIMIPTRRAVGR